MIRRFAARAAGVGGAWLLLLIMLRAHRSEPVILNVCLPVAPRDGSTQWSVPTIWFEAVSPCCGAVCWWSQTPDQPMIIECSCEHQKENSSMSFDAGVVQIRCPLCGVEVDMKVRAEWVSHEVSSPSTFGATTGAA